MTLRLTARDVWRWAADSKDKKRTVNRWLESIDAIVPLMVSRRPSSTGRRPMVVALTLDGERGYRLHAVTVAGRPAEVDICEQAPQWVLDALAWVRRNPAVDQ